MNMSNTGKAVKDLRHKTLRKFSSEQKHGLSPIARQCRIERSAP